MLYDLPKSQKKHARAAIDKGIDKEFETGMKEFAGIIDKWKDKETTNSDAYHELFKAIRNFDKFIARHYDRITGGHYFEIVAFLLARKAITEEDIIAFNDEIREEIITAAEMFVEKL
jgi:hypothetical protein